MASKIDFATALDVRRDDHRPLRFLAEAAHLWLDLARFDRARESFEGLLALAPNSPVGWLGLGSVCLAEGNYREVERFAKQAGRVPGADANTMAQAATLRGRALLAGGRLREAAAALQQAAEVDRDGPAGDVARELLAQMEQEPPPPSPGAAR
ncbi:MAG: tetratricopeptide repeat protein [Planctomycetota bacterium]